MAEHKLLTPSELAEMRAMWEKATPGPWRTGWCGEDCEPEDINQVYTEHPDQQELSSSWCGSHNAVCLVGNSEYCDNRNKENDAAFIAASHELIPRLLDEVEWLHRALDEWRRAHNAAGTE